MTAFFAAAWSSGIVGMAMNGLGLANVFAGASVTADFTHDGIPDLVIAMGEDVAAGAKRHGPTPGRLLLLKGKGDGTFVDGSALLTGGGRFNASVRKMRVGDFNGDGRPDFVTATNYEDGRAIPDPQAAAAPQTVFLSSKGRMVKTFLGLTTWGHALATGDWDGDGKDDIVVGGFTQEPGQTTGTAAFLQRGNGVFERIFLPDRHGATEAIADINGDGVTELVDYWTDNTNASGLRVTANAGDGTPGATQFFPESYVRFENGIGWNKDPGVFKIRLDQNGHEYADEGIHDIKVGDIDGDGRDDIVAVRFGFEMHYVKGVLSEYGAKSHTFLELYSDKGSGLQTMPTRIFGWASPMFGLFDYRLIDWNGDGHLDIFVPSPELQKQFAQVFLNDGAGNFRPIPRTDLPAVSFPSAVADPIDANSDGIMDVMIRLTELTRQFMPVPPVVNTTLFLGTKRFYTDAGFLNPALRGVPGFNNDFYLGAHPEVRVLIKQHKFKDALDHYLRAGRKAGWQPFAIGTTVFGSDRNDVIRLREGDETAMGGLGRDVYFGGDGKDTFAFATVADSGKTPKTRDVIGDFVPGFDRIDLSAIDANGAKGGNGRFAFLPTMNAKFNHVAGELRWRQENAGGGKTIIEGDTNGDRVPDFQIELKGLVTLTAADIVR